MTETLQAARYTEDTGDLIRQWITDSGYEISKTKVPQDHIFYARQSNLWQGIEPGAWLVKVTDPYGSYFYSVGDDESSTCCVAQENNLSEAMQRWKRYLWTKVQIDRVEWRYTSAKGVKKHAVYRTVRDHGSLSNTSYCHMELIDASQWMGTGSQDEIDRLATLDYCTSCLRTLNISKDGLTW